ncbi:MAG: SEC-C domain-containing protein [Spirochaetales bacterium]|nr:SEC-C domain-containing protein [Spirochaetales bacterium]
MSRNFGNEKIYDGKKTGKLGTKNNPVKVTVQTKTRAKELEAEVKEKGWELDITVDKNQPEDISQLKMVQRPVKTVVNKNKVGRNEPCPCGSKKKYKHCCGK